MGKRSAVAIGAFGAALLLPGPASAQESLSLTAAPRDYRWSGGAFLGGNFLTNQAELGNSFFDDQVPESAFLIGLRASFLLVRFLEDSAVAPRLSIEAEGKFSFSSTAGNEMRPSQFAPILGWRAHLLVDGWSDRALSPFLLAGAGGETLFADARFGDAPDTDAAFHFGAGARYAFSERYGLRGDFRVGLVPGREDALAPLYEAHLGAYYQFGARTRRSDGARPSSQSLVAETVPAVPPDLRDVDNDGLASIHDRCPGEGEDIDGFEDEDGCPEGDNDGDGLLDAADRCPDLAETQNKFQDEDGCPDEVAPPAPPPSGFRGTIRGIQFMTGSARIRSRSRSTLDTAIILLQGSPTVRIEIAGYADSDEPAGRSLSLKRAEKVKAYLIKNGIAAERIDVVGHGAEHPLASNDSVRGRARNRRIEFVLHE